MDAGPRPQQGALAPTPLQEHEDTNTSQHGRRTRPRGRRGGKLSHADAAGALVPTPLPEQEGTDTSYSYLQEAPALLSNLPSEPTQAMVPSNTQSEGLRNARTVFWKQSKGHALNLPSTFAQLIMSGHTPLGVYLSCSLSQASAPAGRGGVVNPLDLMPLPPASLTAVHAAFQRSTISSLEHQAQFLQPVFEWLKLMIDILNFQYGQRDPCDTHLFGPLTDPQLEAQTSLAHAGLLFLQRNSLECQPVAFIRTDMAEAQKQPNRTDQKEGRREPPRDFVYKLIDFTLRVLEHPRPAQSLRRAVAELWERIQDMRPSTRYMLNEFWKWVHCEGPLCELNWSGLTDEVWSAIAIAPLYISRTSGQNKPLSL